jgi:hypothetical protein
MADAMTAREASLSKFDFHNRNTSCSAFSGRKSPSRVTSTSDLLNLWDFLTEWVVVALSCKKVTEEKAVCTMGAISNLSVKHTRKGSNGLGEVDVPSSKLWGAQTARSLKHFSIERDLTLREMTAAYAALQKAAASARHAGRWVDHAMTCNDHINESGGDIVVDIMGTDAPTIIGGVLQRNPFFVPPIEFFREFPERRAGRNASTSTGS